MPYRQGTAREDHALHMAFRRSLAEQGGGSRDAEGQLRAALAASLEVCAPAIILSSHVQLQYHMATWHPNSHSMKGLKDMPL